MARKYVIVDNCIPILFTEANKHSDVARNLSVTSAGFWDLNHDRTKVSVWGESLSLKKKSLPDDAVFIEKMLGIS